MNLKDEELLKLTKLISQQIEHVTCIECCKYYIAPQTAPCGHTLCHTCWSGRLECAYCAKPVGRRTLRHNGPIQQLTENLHGLCDILEKLFNIKVNEFMMEAESVTNVDHTVRDWLASSQNQFTNPSLSFEKFSQDVMPPNPLNVSSNKIQIHTNTAKGKSLKKVVYVPNIPQDDWDKIETMPDTEDIRRDKENVVGPMDIEPFMMDDDNEYTANHPRRSSRKRELKSSDKNKNTHGDTLENTNSKDSSEETDKKSIKTKQHWNNVKKMRKEFSKLNKNRNKLNVSIEMCKKTQFNGKPQKELPPAATCVLDIDENTPDILHNENPVIDHCADNKSLEPNTNTKVKGNESMTISDNNQNTVQDQNITKTKSNTFQKPTQHETLNASIPKNHGKLPFYKRSALHPMSTEPSKLQENVPYTINSTKKNHNIVVESNADANDDIEITIQVANTIANIVIKRKCDMQLKINTDQAIQTSCFEPLVQNVNEEKTSSKNIPSQNIVFNVGGKHIQVSNKYTTQSVSNLQVEEKKNSPTNDNIEPEKKNTASADTVTASNKFEITDSVEKELSKIMEIEEADKISSAKSTNVAKNISAKNNSQQKTQKAVHSDLEYLNDLDIFDSESVKEADVQLLQNTEHAPSEILLSTVKTKNKSQRATQKRFKGTSDEDVLPKAKKAKTDQGMGSQQQNQLDNDSVNYDVIMGTVFPAIDAEIEETRQSQTIKNTFIPNVNSQLEVENDKTITNDKQTQNVNLPKTLNVIQSSQVINCNNQKDSENIFSTEKENENVEVTDLVSANNKLPVDVPLSNMEEFLTPAISQAENFDDNMNDDSDKSVVEDTPQKTSFTKLKQKSGGASKESSQTPRSEIPDVTKKTVSKSATKTSIINLTDTSIAKSDDNVTAIKKMDGKPPETPLTINKFVDHIQHNSTPLAKKSLDFNDDMDDLTLCATTDVAKTTQEREFMIKAFEKTPSAPVAKPQTLRSLALKHKKFVIAGSCLSAAENSNLRKLCASNKWVYQDKYTNDLTHLVVGVDEENKAQRSVKYMCALASSKWIISYEWVEKSLQSKDLVSEEPFEALDDTGHPGPRRSRVAVQKLFQGITFFCMEPFSVLDVTTLKSMIEAAGGRVVHESREVRVTSKTTAPAILLAEPENTQEDRFIYMTMELSIVPVNYEWVLNCLGSYTLTSIYELLLCPASLLPKVISNWPQELLARDEESPV